MAGPQLKLNDAQLAVLRWVAEGSPEDVMEGYAHRLSAAALRSRGLVKISGRGPTWRAQITPEGESFLRGLSDIGKVKAVSSSSQKRRKSPLAAKRADPPRSEIPKLVLPRDLRGAHPLVIATRDAARELKAEHDGRLWLGPQAGVAQLVLSRSLLRRALLVLHGLTRESIKRGWCVVSYTNASYGDKPGIAIEIRGRPYPVEIHELMESLPFTEADVVAWRTEVQWRYELERRADQLPPAYLKPKRATGRLRLRLPSDFGERASWSDGQRGLLEGKLSSVLKTLEERADAADQRAMEEARRQEERRREREAEQRRAMRARLEKERLQRLLAEVEAWQKCADLRAYVTELERKLPGLEGEERSRIATWCRWAKDWADRSDPSRNTSLIAGLEEEGERATGR